MKRLLIVLLFLIPISGFAKSAFLEKLGFHVLENVNVSYLEHGTANPLKIAQSYGMPIKIERWEMLDRREPDINLRYEEWIWDGLRIKYFRVISPTKEPHKYKKSGLWVKEIEITKPRFVLFGGAQIGDDKKEFIRKIHSEEINQIQNDNIRKHSFDIDHEYKIDGSDINAAGHVRITIYIDERQRVEKVRWWYFAD